MSKQKAVLPNQNDLKINIDMEFLDAVASHGSHPCECGLLKLID